MPSAYKDLVKSAQSLLGSGSLNDKQKNRLSTLFSGGSMTSDAEGAGSAGRPANGSGDVARSIKKVLTPEYPALKDEVLRDHPVFALDDTTQNMLTAAGKAATNMASGILDPETVKQISMISAEKALKGGLGISQAGRNLQARDLGLTALDLQTKGIEAATNLGSLSMDFAMKKAAWLSDMKKLDLSAAELRVKSLQMDREESRARFAALGAAISDYHNTIYKFKMTRGDSQGRIDDASTDYMALVDDMMKTWRMG